MNIYARFLDSNYTQLKQRKEMNRFPRFHRSLLKYGMFFE